MSQRRLLQFAAVEQYYISHESRRGVVRLVRTLLLCESQGLSTLLLTFMVIAEKDNFHLFLMTFWCILARRSSRNGIE